MTRSRMVGLWCGAAGLAGLVQTGFCAPQAVPQLRLVGDWSVAVTMPLPDRTLTATAAVAPPAMVEVTAEKYEALPLYNPNGGGWNNGARLRGVLADECTTRHLLDPTSVMLRTGPGGEAPLLERGKDYEVEPSWGTFGRLPQGALEENQPVYATYRHHLLRLDSILLTPDQVMVVRPGRPAASLPQPPALQQGEHRLANIWIPGGIPKLTEDHLFPILESVYPEPLQPRPTPAERFLPQTMEKLRRGQPLTILAWGDSVTDGGYLADPARDRWQEQFWRRLQERYPGQPIVLKTEAWGGRNTDTYLAQPPGSPHNYQETVLALKPDLIISEFVNDAGLSPEQVEERYGKLRADFQAIGAEWIILTPHYVRPDWMGLTREREVDEDPRPYVQGLRAFAARHGVALADASLRYGRLWRQGIPYSTLMENSINHPNPQGMKLFADSLMALFP